MVLAAAAAVLVPAVGTAHPTGVPDIVLIHLDGPPGVDIGGLRSAFFPLIGEPLEETVILEALQRAALDAQLGGIDVETVRQEDGSGLALIVRYDGKPAFIELIDVKVSTAQGDDHTEGQRLWRLVQAQEDGLRLAQGRRFHPYHLWLDVRSLKRWYRERGHLDATVRHELRVRGELVVVEIRAIPGPRYQLGKLEVEGPSAGVGVDRLRSDVGLRPSPAGMAKAAERLRKAICRQGFPYASAKVTERKPAAAVLDLEFQVDRGSPPVRIVDVRVIGAEVPAELLQTLHISPGASYCVDLLEEARRLVSAHLRDAGFPNAHVEVRERPRGPSKVAVFVEVDRRERASVARVWFRGHRVTRDKVLAQLVSVAAGQRFAQSEIDTTVDNLRRSGLFRRVSHSVIEGEEAGEVYVVFDLVERDLVQVDFDARKVILHNMDISLPTSVAEATDGVSLRGGGQRVRLTGSPSRIGVGLRDPFLFTDLLAAVDLDLIFYDFGELDETVGLFQVGAGLTALGKQFTALLLLFADTTVRSAPSAYNSLPLRQDTGGAATGLGLELSLDLSRLDDERIAYLGVALDASARSSGLAGDRPWTATSTGISLAAPLYRNGRGQHWVVEASTRWRLLFDAGISGGQIADDGLLFAHRLLTPKARGYAGDALGQPLQVDGDQVLIGHRATWESTASLRVPLPWRRNALRAFLDLASGGDLELKPWEEDALRPGVGVGLDFSLFDERLEGALYGTLPLKDGPTPEYYVLSAGGSFN